jgi:hypothetical protein
LLIKDTSSVTVSCASSTSHENKDTGCSDFFSSVIESWTVYIPFFFGRNSSRVTVPWWLPLECSLSIVSTPLHADPEQLAAFFLLTSLEHTKEVIPVWGKFSIYCSSWNKAGEGGFGP